jgi:hypothetical protein
VDISPKEKPHRALSFSLREISLPLGRKREIGGYKIRFSLN